jgi:CRISPR/Cas system CSM-associated protein Csm2 small subunit
MKASAHQDITAAMIRCMRTTLTLDDDLAVELRRIQAESGQSWKQVVNDVVRAGVALRHARGRETHQVRRTKSVSLGRPLMADVSNVHETLSLAEGDVRG